MSDSNDITVLNPGLYKNLLAQVESIYRHSNELIVIGSVIGSNGICESTS